ncbi:MAG: hypothetical protein NZ903_01895, partial [Candidatus Micrarchaeota archaeon]|nr:hypothetical protein [Candidatus Micrarchaeota archaeon]
MQRFFLILFILFIINNAIAVNICPIDKNPTEITIEHTRHPVNIPIGVYDNRIDVTITLNAIDRETGKKIPLANKEILIDITIVDKFIGRDNKGNFYLTTQSAPFLINTSNEGKISFSIYTQPPLLEKSIDPRKISYSITASFTPKPREPFMGSLQTERYVPGFIPLLSAQACAPLLIIFAILIAAMFAAGKNPFGLFDFSRVAFKAPGPSSGRVTQRQKLTLAGIAAGSAQAALKTAVGPYMRKGMVKIENAVKKGVSSAKKGIASMIQKKSPTVGTQQAQASAQPKKPTFLTKTVRTVGDVLYLPVEFLKRVSGERRITTREKETLNEQRKKVPGLREEPTRRGLLSRVFGETVETPPPSFERIKTTFFQSLLTNIGRLGVRPWSLAYAQTPPISREIKEVYTKEEQTEIKERVKRVYGIYLKEGEIDQNGLTEKGKMRILDTIKETGGIEKYNKIIEQLKSGKTKLEILEYIVLLNGLIERENSKYLTPEQKAEIKEQIKMLFESDNNKLIKNLEKMRANEIKNLLNYISSNGALIGFDKERLIVDGKINGAAYYAAYGSEEMKFKSRVSHLLADVYGIDLNRIFDAYQSGDPVKINKVLSKNLKDIADDPNKLAVFNYIMKDVQIGTMHRFLDKLEIRDEKGNLITDPLLKIKKFLEMDYGSVENREQLIKNVIQTLGSESKLQIFEKAVKIVNGEKSSVNEQTVYYTVTKGEEVLNERIKALEKEKDELKEKYGSSPPGSIGYEKINEIERKIDGVRRELSEVRKAIQNIKSEADNLLLMREIYEKSKTINPELASFASPTPDSLFYIRKISEAEAIRRAVDSSIKIISENSYADQKINIVSEEIRNSVNLPPEKNKTEIDKKFSECIESVDKQIQEYNKISGNNIELFQKPSFLKEIYENVSDAK